MNILGFKRRPRSRAAVAWWLVGLFLLGALLLLKPRINGDAFSYYAWLRSPVFDADLDFTNEYTTYNTGGYWTAVEETTETGLKANPFAIGPALLWLPWFALAYALSVVANLLLGWPNDGYGFFYQLLIPLGTLVYAFIGAGLLSSALRRFVSTRAMQLAVYGVLLASPLLNYLFNEPASSHTLSFFGVSLFVWYWQGHRPEENPSDSYLAGLIGGLITLIRWQQIILLVPFGLYLLYKKRPLNLVLFGVGILSLASLQTLAWKVVYGSFLTIPQTGSFFIPTDQPLTWGMQILRLWFSPNHGLFYWTPLMLLAVWGLLLMLRSHRKWAGYALGAFLLSSLVNGKLWEFYGGYGFGARRMIELMPFLAFGLAWLWEKHLNRTWAYLLSGGFILWNGLLWLQYRAGEISPTGALAFPAWISGQFTHALAGLRVAVGQSAVVSELYFATQGDAMAYLRAGLAAGLILLVFWSVLRLARLAASTLA